MKYLIGGNAMLRITLEHAPTETQSVHYCDTLKWTSYDGHPYLLICTHNEYKEIDLLLNRPVTITQVEDTTEEKELKLFDFLFDKKFDKIS